MAVSEELLKHAQEIVLEDVIIMVFVEIVSLSFSRGFFFKGREIIKQLK